MKKFMLVLLIVLWPVSARASLIKYRISFTIPDQFLSFPVGFARVIVSFTQNTEGDPFYQLVSGAFDVVTLYGGNSVDHPLSELTVLSSTDVQIFTTDPSFAARIYMLYNDPLGPLPLASQLPEPDLLMTSFGSEGGVPRCSGCPLGFGTISPVTLERGEFNFSKIPEPGTWLLMGVGLVGLGLVARRRGKG